MAADDPNKQEYNPGERIWNNKFESAGAPSPLHSMETSGGDSSDTSPDSSSNDLGNDVRNKESTSGAWANNFTGKQQSKGGLKAFGDKAKILFKKKGATAAIIALLGGGASVPFLGAASLPFSIIGNMDAKSMMHGLEQYSEDYMGFSIFNTNKASVSSTANKIKGLRDTEITQLKAQGVELEGPTKTITGKTTFTSVTFEGQTYHAGAEFNNAMRSNPAFRKAMVFNKGSYWKSAKSSFAAKVKSLYKIDPNPDLTGKDDKEKNKKLFAESVEGTDSHSGVSDTDQTQKDKNGNDPNAAQKAEAESVAGELNSQVEAEKTAIANGDFTPEMAADSNMGNVGSELSKNGVDVAGDATKSLGGKIWGYVNALGPLDTVCTIYQAANTANTLARTVALFNIVRFAMTIRATIERAKAGDDNGKDTAYLMSLIQQKDPTTGQSFDETSYAAFLFNGTLSSEPSSVSAFGGQAMIALYLAMHAIHSIFGDIASGFTLGAVSATAANGRRFLKDACGLATNLGVQIAATVVSFVAAIFTGGGSAAGEEALNLGLKEGFQMIVKKMVETFGKDAIKKIVKEQGEKIAEEGVLKYMARNSWKAFSSMWKGMTAWDKVGLLMAGVSAFGMGYIVDALAGGNVAGFIKNGFSAFDAIGTGWNQYETVNGIASGGNMATYAQATAYQQTQQTYDNQYVADMKYQAKDTPFDLTTPYSTLGAAVLGMQKTIGISASLSLPSTLMSVASLPFKLPSLFAAHADDTTPTPQQIGDQLSNPFFQDNKIATTTTGSAQVIFQKHYSFQDILDKLVDSSNPQMTYDGDDQSTGEPILSIIPGSDLDKYAQKCHNPDRTEPDPEFEDDEGDNLYDTSTCVAGGSNYDSTNYPLYDDAIRFIGQVSPDASNASSTSGSGTTAPTGDMPANAVAQGAGWALKDNTDYSSVSCAAGTTDDGTYTDKGNGTTVRVCTVKGQKIASVISQNVVNLLAAATSAGLNITLSSGLRTYEEQVALRNSNCGGNMTAPASSCHPPTAIPGQSNHEKGTAVDWGLNGQSFCYPNATCAAGANAGYDWFMKNAATYGFHKLSSEAWHWSTDGG